MPNRKKIAPGALLGSARRRRILFTLRFVLTAASG